MHSEGRNRVVTNSMVEQTFSVTVDSPHGKQAIEQFAHFLNKVADEAEARWGIGIQIEREKETEHSTEFDE